MHLNQDGSLDALFRYDGTTCTNMGLPLTFHYNVKLGPSVEGYPIREQRCVPAPGDTGHTAMCQYVVNPVGLMTAIDQRETAERRTIGCCLIVAAQSQRCRLLL